ncbi:hypothetical protein Pcinc_027190 [Petrolisthes cinctipes]|uniref:Uncharacterized protein n=1 Tax=Petrolisthes cinctipes TaxID=88211 RepID=A0AAE1KB67_PETCI|nr:hypothetical protein Pcinc_027190 [Petrolisthes cinctipes]
MLKDSLNFKVVRDILDYGPQYNEYHWSDGTNIPGPVRIGQKHYRKAFNNTEEGPGGLVTITPTSGPLQQQHLGIPGAGAGRGTGDGAGQVQVRQVGSPFDMTKYKTEMCRTFMYTGLCEYGTPVCTPMVPLTYVATPDTQCSVPKSARPFIRRGTACMGVGVSVRHETE